MRPIWAAIRPLISIVFPLVLVSCTSSGDISNPFERRLTWFSHISGEDIRNGCAPGAPDRYRLTYNANRAQQVRLYDIGLSGDNKNVPPDGAAAAIDVLDGPVDITRIPVFDDIFRPWRPKRQAFTLEAEALRQLRLDLIEAGLTKGAPVGRVLASPSYFWLAAACIDSRFAFQVWEHPDQSYATLGFPAILFARDGSRVSPRLTPREKSRIVNYPNDRQQAEIHRDTYDHYDLLVTAVGVEPGTIYPRR